ncbi:MAG: (2Fe-2S)-binding protein [Acidimicrobiia bacterium]|jgi:carbon-monoxide dehydrogenase small subunit
MGPGEPTVSLVVNGTSRSVTAPASMTLLELVRTRIGLTGSKECCSEGECGACTMIVDGVPINACLMLAVEADGSEVTTIEGVGSDGMTRLQESFLEAGAVQCGFCIPGMVVAATALLEHNPQPTEPEIREALAGNLCRCGGYSRITAAVRRATLPEATDV